MGTIESVIKGRLLELGMTGAELARIVGINQPALNKIYNRNSARRETLENIANALKIPMSAFYGDPTTVSNVKLVNDPIYKELPFVSVSARASFVSSLISNTPIELDTFHVLVTDNSEDLKDNMVFEIDGDSMEPTLWAKMKVRVKKVNENDWEFIPSGIYLVHYRQEYLVVKRIKSNDMQTSGTITLHSDNTETGGTLTIGKKDINTIWKVLRIVDAPIR